MAIGNCFKSCFILYMLKLNNYYVIFTAHFVVKSYNRLLLWTCSGISLTLTSIHCPHFPQLVEPSSIQIVVTSLHPSS